MSSRFSRRVLVSIAVSCLVLLSGVLVVGSAPAFAATQSDVTAVDATDVDYTNGESGSTVTVTHEDGASNVTIAVLPDGEVATAENAVLISTENPGESDTETTFSVDSLDTGKYTVYAAADTDPPSGSESLDTFAERETTLEFKGITVSFDSAQLDNTEQGDTNYEAVVWVNNTGLSTDAEDVTFTFGGDVFEETNLDVERNAGQSGQISFEFDIPEDMELGDAELQVETGSGQSSDTEPITVTGFKVDIQEYPQTTVTEGEEIEVEADVQHIDPSGQDDTQTVVLEVDGQQVDGEEVAGLSGGSVRPVTFSYTIQDGDAPEIEVTVASEDDQENVTIDVNEKATFEVEINETNDPITAGETLEVSAIVENTGDVAGQKTVELVGFGGDTVDSQSVSLDPGAAKTVTLAWQTEETDAGSSTIEVQTPDDSVEQVVTVDSPQPAIFAVENVSTNSPVVEGTALVFDATINNTGDEAATKELAFSIDGTDVDSDDELGSRTTFEVEGQQQDGFELKLDGNEAVNVTVRYETRVETDFPAISTVLDSSDESVGEEVVVAINCSTVDMQGEGTEALPYRILEPRDLQCVGGGAYGLDAHYELIDNINASTGEWNGGNGFEPIGNSSVPFTGSFDGNGHDVTNLVINRSDESRVGTFGSVENATIVDVHVDGTVRGTDRVGLLAGEIDQGTLFDLSTSGSSVGTDQVGGVIGYTNSTQGERLVGNATVQGAFAVGGVVGRASGGEIASSSSFEKTTGGSAVGGVVGWNGGTIVDTVSSGNVSGDRGIGGIAGENHGGDISNISVDVSVVGETYVGGLIGENLAGEVTDAVTRGTVEASGNPVGGLMGFNDGTVTRAEANVSVEGSRMVGGLVGRNEGTIQRSQATGEALGRANELTRVGGLVGDNDGGTVLESVANSTVRGMDRVGGFVGYNREGGTVNDSVASGPVSGDFEAGGFAGRNTGTFDNATATGAVTAYEESLQRGGGLVGFNEGQVVDALATGNVTGFERIGGLVGRNTGTVSDATANNLVSGTGAIGGAVGWNGGTVSGVSTTGNVTGVELIGGVVGENSATVIDVVGNATVTGSSAVGGVVGWNGGEVSESYATGATEGELSVGGFVGQHESGEIVAVYATGSVDGNESVGGLAGTQNGGNVTQTYATGATTGADAVGGLVGEFNDGSITASYWDRETTGQSSSDGVDDIYGLATFDMRGLRAQSNMGELDFRTTWGLVVSPDDYPELRDPNAALELQEQKTLGNSVSVEFVRYDMLPYVVVITNESGGVYGVSSIQNVGYAGSLSVELSTLLEQNQTVTATLYPVDRNGEYDEPLEIEGEVVNASAEVIIDDEGVIDVNGNGDGATDTNGDGRLNDVDGDGEFDIFDVQVLFGNLDNEVVQENAELFDFDGDEGGTVDIFDVQALFSQLSE